MGVICTQLVNSDMRILYFFKWIIFFFFCACQEKSKSEVECIVTDKYPSGAVRGTLCTHTKTNEQLIRRFHESGKLLAIVPAKDSLRNGIGVAFHENGDTASILEFKLGKLDGIQRWFEGGCLTRANVYENDILVAEEYEYSVNGILMEYVYRKNGEITYHAFFDEHGYFAGDTGFALIQGYAACRDTSLTRRNTLNVGDTINFLLSTINPNLRNVCLELKLLTHNMTTGEKTTEVLTIADNHLNTTHEIVMCQSGRYYFAVYLDVTRVSTQQRRTNYSDFDVIVR